MTANEQNGVKVSAPALYGDAAAVAASGMPLPSLRVLQAAGAIQAQKAPKVHGGFKRMWRGEDVLIASIGAAISEHFAWNIRIVAEAMAKTRPGIWAALVVSIAETMSPEAGALVESSSHDWHLDLIDRKFLFLRVPLHDTMLNIDAAFGQTDLILGWATSKDTFAMLPWSLGHPKGSAGIADKVSPLGFAQAQRIYDLAMATHANAFSTASINISMQVRATWHRLREIDAHLIQQATP